MFRMRWSSLLLILASAACLTSAEYGGVWRGGREYTYRLEGSSLTGLLEDSAGSQSTGLRLRAVLRIQASSHSHLSVQIDEAEFGEVVSTTEEHPSEERLHYIPLTLHSGPFQVTLQNGVVKELVVEESWPDWELNMLKAFVGALQVNTSAANLNQPRRNFPPVSPSGISGVYKTMEDSIYGRYETLYEVSELPAYLGVPPAEVALPPELLSTGDSGGNYISVRKSRNFSESGREGQHHRRVYHHAMGGDAKWEPGSSRMGSFITRSSVSRMLLQGDPAGGYLLLSSKGQEKILLAPELRSGGQGLVQSTLDLRLESVEVISSGASSPQSPYSPRKIDLIYQYPTKTYSDDNSQIGLIHQDPTKIKSDEEDSQMGLYQKNPTKIGVEEENSQIGLIRKTSTKVGNEDDSQIGLIRKTSTKVDYEDNSQIGLIRKTSTKIGSEDDSQVGLIHQDPAKIRSDEEDDQLPLFHMHPTKIRSEEGDSQIGLIRKSSTKVGNEDNSQIGLIHKSTTDEATEDGEGYHRMSVGLAAAPTAPYLPLHVGLQGRPVSTGAGFRAVDQLVRISRQVGGDTLQEPSRALSQFLILTRLLRTLSAGSLQAAGEQLHSAVAAAQAADSGTRPSREELAWWAYRDAVGQAGTPPALLSVAHWLRTGQVGGREAATLVALTATSVRLPTPDYIAVFFELTKEHETKPWLGENAVLSLGDLARLGLVLGGRREAYSRFPLHTFGPLATAADGARQGTTDSSRSRQHQQLEPHPLLVQIMDYMDERLHSALAARPQNTSRAQLYIQALGNIAHPQILTSYEPYLEGEKNCTRFQRLLMVASLDRLGQTFPSQTQRVLYRLYTNRGESGEVRSAAVTGLLKTKPPLLMLQRMALDTSFEHSRMVRAAVWSALVSAARQPINKYNKLLTQDARAALDHLGGESLLSEEFRRMPAYNYLRSHWMEREQLGYKHYFSFLKSRRAPYPSLLPEVLLYSLRRSFAGGFKLDSTELGLLSSGSVEELISALWRGLAGASPSEVRRRKEGGDTADLPPSQGEKQGDGTKKKKQKKERTAFPPGGQWSKHRLQEILEKMRLEQEETEGQQPLEGNFWISALGSRSQFYFDNSTIERLLDIGRQKESGSLAYNMTQYYPGHSYQLAFPTGLGLAFHYTLEQPSLLSLSASAKRPPRQSRDRAGFNIDLQFMYSTKQESQFGFVAPFSGKRFLVGLERDWTVRLPAVSLSSSLQLDGGGGEVRTSRLHVGLAHLPLSPPADPSVKLLSYKSAVYSCAQPVDQLIPPLSSPAVRRIHSPGRHQFETRIGEELTGFAVNVSSTGDGALEDLYQIYTTAQEYSPMSLLLFGPQLLLDPTANNREISLSWSPKDSKSGGVALTARYTVATGGEVRTPGAGGSGSGQKSSEHSSRHQERSAGAAGSESGRNSSEHSSWYQESSVGDGVRSAGVGGSESGQNFSDHISRHQEKSAGGRSDRGQNFSSSVWWTSDPGSEHHHHHHDEGGDVLRRMLNGTKEERETALELDLTVVFWGRKQTEGDGTPRDRSCKVYKGGLAYTSQLGGRYSLAGLFNNFTHHTSGEKQPRTAEVIVELGRSPQTSARKDSPVPEDPANPSFTSSNWGEMRSNSTDLYNLSLSYRNLPEALRYHTRELYTRWTAPNLWPQDLRMVEVAKTEEGGRVSGELEATGLPGELLERAAARLMWGVAAAASTDVTMRSPSPESLLFFPQSNPWCRVTGREVRTLDGGSFAVNLGTRPYLLLSGGHLDRTPPLRIILQQGADGFLVELLIGGDVVEIQPEREDAKSANFKLNGVRLEMEEGGMRRHLGGTLQLYRTSEGGLKVHSQTLGFQLFYFLRSLRLEVTERTRFPGTGGGVRGLCGDFDGESYNDLLTSEGFLVSHPQDFLSSYALDEEEVPKITGIKEKIIMRNVITDKETGLNQLNKSTEKSVDLKTQDVETIPDELLNLLTTRILHTRDRTCFSTRPGLSCGPGSRPDRLIERTIEFHCLDKKSPLSGHWERLVKLGAKPDFSAKGSNHWATLKVPQDCVAN